MRYRFDDLGWSEFERLCQAALSARYGLAVEAWGGREDWGRDAWAEGPLAFPDPEAPANPGPFLFQCKFVENSEAIGNERALARLEASLGAEARRIAERIEQGWEAPVQYVVMTNARVPDRSRAAVLSGLEGRLPPGTRVKLVPGQDLEALVAGTPGVRLSFPQLLGTSDLRALMRETLDRDLLTRSNDLLGAASRLAEIYVPTRAHQRAIRSLSAHGFTVLTGPPEAGKTSIARMIALVQASAGWQVVDSSLGPAVFDRQYRTERAQLFVADDAFGSTEYRPDFAREWEEAFPRVFRALGERHWMIWVSRSAPLRAALSRISPREEAEAFPEPGEVLVDAGRLSREEKAMVLFRHANVASLHPAGAEHLRREARAIVGASQFTPLRARRVVERVASLDPEASAAALDAAVSEEMNRPGRLMRRAFAALTGEQQAFAYALLDVASIGRCMLPQDAWRQHRADGMNPDADVVAAGLVGHMLSELRPADSDRSLYNWIHPSWRDVTIEALMEDAAARQSFLSRGGMEAMMLALSYAGGATGTRALPLLRLDEDWEAIQRRVPELIGTSRPRGGNNASRLMDALRALLKGLSVPPPGLRRLVALVLEEVRRDWDPEPGRGDESRWKMFIELSGEARPAVQRPRLNRLWREHLDTLSRVDATSLHRERYGVSRAFEFFRLAVDVDPASACRHGYPEEWMGRTEEILEDLAVNLDRRQRSLEKLRAASLDELDDMGETAFELWSLAKDLAGRVPAGRARAKALAERAERLYQDTVEAERALFAARRAPGRPEPPSIPISDNGERMTDEDLATLFAALGDENAAR